MSTLYVDRRNVSLSCDGEALVFHENGERIGTVPMEPLQRVIMRGGVSLDTSLLGRLGSHGIGVIILSGRKDEPLLFLPRAHNDATRRIAQYRAATDPDACLAIARHLVQGKLGAQIRFLRDRLETRLDARYMVRRAIESLSSMHGRVDETPAIVELRGLEGASANLYFSALAALVPESLNFHGRNRRPPRDPLNAVLSLGYTLLHAEAVLGAHAMGLDPCIGFYHAPAFGRESLACDLVEAWRPEVDAWAIGLFNRQELRAENFSTTREGCLLGKAGREHFYRAWEPLAENLRKHLENQVQSLITMILPEQAAGQGAFQPGAESVQGEAGD